MQSASFKINVNIEVLTYDLATIFSKKGYRCKVNKGNNNYFLEIHKDRSIALLGTPTIILATLVPIEDGVGIEVKEIYSKINAENITKDIVYHLLLVPFVRKRIEAYDLEKKVFHTIVNEIKLRIKEKLK